MTGKTRGVDSFGSMVEAAEQRLGRAMVSGVLALMRAPSVSKLLPVTRNQAASRTTLISSETNWLCEDDPDRNYGTDIQLRTRLGKGNNCHAIVRFDLSGIPSTAKIVSGIFGIYEESIRNNAGTITVYRLTESWTRLGSNWSKRDGTTNWTAPGGTYDATPLGSFQPTSVGFKAFDVTSIVQNWVNGTYANNGFILVANTTEETSDAASTKETVNFEAPYLDIGYTLNESTKVDAGGI